MLRFLAGLLVGLAAGGAAVYFLVPRAAPAPMAVAPAPAPAERPRRPRRGPRTPARATEPTEPAEPVALTAADLRSTTDGDALRAGVSLDMSSEVEPRDLTQDEIDAAFARRADALVRCITDARAGASLSGRVVAGVVVDPVGRVLRTRVEAPAWLVRHGLYACARPVLLGLRFPAAGKESVVTIPFDLSE